MAYKIPKSKFVRLPGELVGPRPLEVHNAVGFHFILKGDPLAIKETINRSLNDPFGLRKHFYLSNPLVLISHYNVSCAEGCQVKEWKKNICKKKVCGYSIKTEQRGKMHSRFKSNSLFISIFPKGRDGRTYRFSPYAFIDDGTILAFYRENFGLNMTLADSQWKEQPFEDLLHDFDLEVNAHLLLDDIQEFNTFRRELIVKIDARDKKEGNLLVPRWNNLPETREGFRAHLKEKLSKEIYHLEYNDLLNVSEALLGQGRRIALKQFRNLPDGERAIMKGVTSFVKQTLSFKEAGIMQDEYWIDLLSKSVSTAKNFPIREDLGLGETNRAFAAFFTRQSYKYVNERFVVEPERI